MNTYQLTNQQFESLLKDSNIHLPEVSSQDIKLLEKLLVPQFIENCPDTSAKFIIEHYLNVIIDYARKHQEIWLSNEESSKVNPNIIKFHNYLKNVDIYSISSFLILIPEDLLTNKNFYNSIAQINNNLDIFNNNTYLSLCIDIIKENLENQPLNVVEEQGILKIKDTVSHIVSVRASENLLINTPFPYPEYQKYDFNDANLFNIQYDFLDNPKSEEAHYYFDELTQDNSLFAVDIYDEFKDVFKDNSFNLLRNIENLSNKKLKLELQKKMLENYDFSDFRHKYLERYLGNVDSFKDFAFNSKNSTFTLGPLDALSSIFDTASHSYYAQSQNLPGFLKLFKETVNLIFNSDEFIKSTEIVKDSYSNTEKKTFFSNLLNNDKILKNYAILPKEARLNLSAYFVDFYFNEQKKTNENSSIFFNKGSLSPIIGNFQSNYSLPDFNINILDIIPFFDSYKENILSYKHIFKILALPNLDLNKVINNKEIKHIFFDIVEELFSIKETTNIDDSPFLSYLQKNELFPNFFVIMDSLTKSILEDPFNKFYSYPQSFKEKISLFKKENWSEAHSLFQNFEFNISYHFNDALNRAIVNEIKSNPDLYRGKASLKSTFELEFHRNYPTLSQLLSEDFSEIIQNNIINKNILNHLIIKDLYLLEDADNIDKLPASIKNSQEFYDIVRTPEFFRKHTSENMNPYFFEKIYSKNDSDFLLQQLLSEEYEHSIDFTRHHPQLFEFIDDEKINSYQLWTNILAKEKSYLASSFAHESLIFERIPKSVLKNSIFFENVLDTLNYNELTILPKECFENPSNVIKFLESLNSSQLEKPLQQIIKSKIPKLYPLYLKYYDGSDFIESDNLQIVISTINQAILENSIVSNKTISKPLKF